MIIQFLCSRFVLTNLVEVVNNESWKNQFSWKENINRQLYQQCVLTFLYHSLLKNYCTSASLKMKKIFFRRHSFIASKIRTEIITDFAFHFFWRHIFIVRHTSSGNKEKSNNKHFLKNFNKWSNSNTPFWMGVAFGNRNNVPNLTHGFTKYFDML